MAPSKTLYIDMLNKIQRFQLYECGFKCFGFGEE